MKRLFVELECDRSSGITGHRLISGEIHALPRSILCGSIGIYTAGDAICRAGRSILENIPTSRDNGFRTGNPNNWLAAGRPATLTPEYQKIFAAIQADLKAGGPGNWPSTFCIPAGMPAMMSFYDPTEIIVMPNITYILISHDDDSYRRIYTDGREWPTDPEPTFAGYSIGKWVDEDGDGKYNALEVETRFLKAPRGYDTSGMPFARATVRPSSRSGSISTRPTATRSMTRSP